MNTKTVDRQPGAEFNKFSIVEQPCQYWGRVKFVDISFNQLTSIDESVV